MNTDNWAFLISRSIYDSDIFLKPAEWLKIWIYILWKVNYSDTKQFNRWENYFNFDEIARNCKTSYNTVNKCVVFLRKARQIETSKTTRWLIIKVLNYSKYQDIDNYKAKQKQDKSKIEAKQKQDKSNTIKEEKNKRIKKELINIDMSTDLENPKHTKISFEELIKKNIDPLFIENLNKKYRLNWEIIKGEAEKFYLYWTEKNINWKKEKWEMQKTFDIRRRFNTWLWNLKTFWNKANNQKSDIIFWDF